MACIGVDIIEIERIRQAVARWGERFVERVFTPAEQVACRGRPASLAARFAAKEAVMKALGAQNLGWREIEVIAEPSGRPRLRLHGRAQQQAQALGARFEVSLAHCREYAIASVIGTE